MMVDGIVALRGRIGRLTPSRTFVDGQLLDELSVISENGHEDLQREIFCTNSLLGPLGAPGTKEIRIWNRHVFAIESAAGVIEDVQGVRNSYLYRDRFLMLALAASIIMLPYVTWVVLKRLSAVRSLPKIQGGHVDA